MTTECNESGMAGLGAARGSATAGRVKARMEGAAAAIAGRKLDANTYHEDDELHWQWLAGWTDARLARMKSPNIVLDDNAHTS